MAFRQQTLKWAECDYCDFKTEKDMTTKDYYIKAYLRHLKSVHPVKTRDIADLNALLAPVDCYKVIV